MTKPNLESDIKKTLWIVEKIKGDLIYAQHLYAALCNNEFTRNDVWPILTEQKWSCSWRYAGGLIAEVLREGDYMDWYCSGSAGEEITPEEDVKYLEEDEKRVYLTRKSHVSEGLVTEEIKTDLLRLGWIIVTDKTED
jgi:hypothetical protein